MPSLSVLSSTHDADSDNSARKPHGFGNLSGISTVNHASIINGYYRPTKSGEIKVTPSSAQKQRLLLTFNHQLLIMNNVMKMELVLMEIVMVMNYPCTTLLRVHQMVHLMAHCTRGPLESTNSEVMTIKPPSPSKHF